MTYTHRSYDVTVSRAGCALSDCCNMSEFPDDRGLYAIFAPATCRQTRDIRIKRSSVFEFRLPENASRFKHLWSPHT